MLEANYSWDTSAMGVFRGTLSEQDKQRLDNELDSYAKELASSMLFRTDYDELLQMVSEKEISPLLFQWALAVREGMSGRECEIEA